MRCNLLGGLVLGLFCTTPAAASGHMVPGCYARYPVNITPSPPVREMFVLIDQTTALDPALVATLHDNVTRLVRPGTAFTIASFSAFERGHYTEIVAGGVVEPTVPATRRNGISVPALRKLDACLKAQAVYAVRVALAGIAKARQVSAASFAHSEVMASLKQLASRVAASRARDKVVVVVSDMLEHSSVTSFYARRGLRPIDPAIEIRKMAANGLTTNFNGARIWVVGGGILPPESRDAGRTVQALNALETFWRIYFRNSRAQLIAFGRPNLVSPIQ